MSEHDREERGMQVSLLLVTSGCYSVGSSHMTCKKCKYEFCWVCMGRPHVRRSNDFTNLTTHAGPWSEHGTSWYNCNRFDEKASKDARDAQSRSRASLERYLHVRTCAYAKYSIVVTRTCTVLQSLGQPRAVQEAFRRVVREDREENGGDADDVGAFVDRGPVHEESRRRSDQVPNHAHVDLRDGVLPGL